MALYHEGLRQYQEEGMLHPATVPLTNGLTEYKIHIGSEHRFAPYIGRNLLMNMVDGLRGRPRVAGLQLHANVTDLTAQPGKARHGYLVMRSLVDYSYHTSVFDSNTKDAYGLDVPTTITNKDEAEAKISEFRKNFLNLTPDNISVYEFGELSDKEKSAAFGLLSAAFDGSAHVLGTSRQELQITRSSIGYKLGESAAAELTAHRYRTPADLQVLGLGDWQDYVTLTISSYNSAQSDDPGVSTTLSALRTNTGNYQCSATRTERISHDSRDTPQDRTDILKLLSIVQSITEQPDKGRVIAGGDYRFSLAGMVAEGIEHFRQPSLTLNPGINLSEFIS